MAILFREQKQYHKAIGYFKEAIENYRLIKDTTNYLSSIGSLAILYNRMALPDSSLMQLTKCIPILQTLDGHDYDKAMIYERLGDTWFETHHYERSLENYRHAYDLFRNTGNKADQAFEAVNLGKNLTELGHPKEAEYYLLQSYRINDSLHLANYTYDAAAELSELYHSTKDWQQAFQWLTKASRLEDSITQAEQNEKTIELQTRYEAEKKDKEIALLKKDQELRTADLQKERTIKASVFILTGLLLLIGLLIFNRYRLIQKTRRLVEIEKLRNNIARDLHDDIGSALSSIHINSNMALSHPGEQGVVRTQLEKIQKNSGRMMESMGDIVWAISPANDSMENLQAKMKEFLAEILEPLNISYSLTGMTHLKKVRFDIEKRKDIYLVFKEAVNNAAKYSGCTDIIVNIHESNGEMLLQVTDNGRGFDRHAIREGNGLRNMQQRAASIGGSLDIATTAGEGTTITLHIPIT
jgi:signal transduction histidine kinase